MKAGGLKPLAYLAAAGIITNLVLFLGSFFGWTATNTLPVIVICGVLLLGLDLPMWFDPSLPISKFFYFWGAFWIGKPYWAKPIFFAIMVFVLAQVVLVFMQPAPSTPLMIDAQPVLRPDGTVRLVYTEAQKLQRNEAFLRALAIIMIGNFYRSMIYLRFHGKAEVAA